jgi:DNA-binding response OmpR family regulator
MPKENNNILISYSVTKIQERFRTMTIEILIVDDDPEILDIMRLDLEDNPSFVVDTCGSSSLALDKTRNHLYDVIITDWRMPLMNGTQLIRSLRANGCQSYIILYSGHTISSDIRSALDGGADHVIHRAGDPDSEFAELRQEIRHAAGAGQDPVQK